MIPVLVQMSVDYVYSGFSCLQGWILGNWMGALKDRKAIVEQVLGYLEDGIIVPESGIH